MRAIKSENTTPEIAVRRLAHKLGYRFRLHRADLPGKPDLVFAKHKAVIFVHGCFWHWHGCKRSRMPKSNKEYWDKKIGRNITRDRRIARKLRGQGWRAMVVWECRTHDLIRLERRIKRFLDAGQMF